MPLEIEIRLHRRNVSCIARLLEDEAPATCQAVWDSLPLSGEVYHGYYVGHELYTLQPASDIDVSVPENPTVTPAVRDLCYFHMGAQYYDNQFLAERGFSGASALVAVALFYRPQNLLINPETGFAHPGNVFGAIISGLEDVRQAGDEIRLEGVKGERMTFARRRC